MNFPDKKYNTIVIDPPWNISMAGSRNMRKNLSKELPYKTMSIEEIGKLKIGDIANEGAHVYLWATNKTLRNAFDILIRWDVNFHCLIIWVKPSGLAPSFDFMYATEYCLVGFYKKMTQKFLKKFVLNWFEGFNKGGEHSKKPDKFYNLVRDMSPPPRIDLFSRRVIAGFDSWGNEATNEKQLQLGLLGSEKK